MPRFLLLSMVLLSPIPPALAQEPLDLPAGFLAEGPMKIKIRFAKSDLDRLPERDEDGDLVLLTESRLLYRVGSEKRAASPSSLILKITAPDQKAAWEVDKNTRKFKGPKITPLPYELPPPAGKLPGEEQYLYYVLQRLASQADSAFQIGNEPFLKDAKERAAGHAQHVAASSFHADLRLAFETLRDSIEQQITTAQKRKELLAKNLQFLAELEQARVNALRVFQQRSQLGGFGALSGLLLDSPDLFLGGLGSINMAQQTYLREQYELDVLNRSKQKELSDEYLAVLATAALARRLRDQSIDQLPGKIGVPVLESARALAERFAKDKDYGSLITVLEDQVKARFSAPNPWLIADLAWLRSAQSAVFRDKMAGEIIRQAEECARAAGLVPAAARYHSDRALILWSAAALAVKAANLDHGGASWKEAYHPYAVHALRLYSFTDQFKVIDIGGFARENRMVALALAGQTDKALLLGQKLLDIRSGSASYHFYMARLWAVQGKKKELLDHALLAQSNGLGALLPKCSEVGGLLADKKFKVEFENTIKPKVVAWVTLNPGQDKSVVWVENISPFPLTNVKGTLVLTTNAGNQQYSLEFLPLAKGQKTSQSFTPPAAFVSAAAFAIQCDQGVTDPRAIGNKR